MATTSYRRIESVELTIAIIKYMAQKVQPVSGNEIAEALAKPHGTVMCHLATLEEGGFVKRAGGGFEIGIYLGVIWASIKSSRQARISEAHSDLNKITIE